MSSNNSAPIQLGGQPYVFTVDDKQTLNAAVEQLNAVTARLAELETQIENGTLIINERPPIQVVATSGVERPSRIRPTSGWQPTR